MHRSPHPHYVRKVAAVVVVLVCAFWLQGLARNKNLAWGTVGDYFFDHSIMEGLERTVIITVVSIAIAVVLGAVLANMRLSANSVLRGAAGAYVWFFRSMPLLVLLILVYNFSLIYPALGLGVPFGPQFFDVDTKNLVQPVTAPSSPSGSSRRPTPPRCCGRRSCPYRTGSGKRRRPWECRTSAPCGGSSSRRPCGWRCRRSPTSRSTC